jgi:hypothetical protein
MTEIQNMKIAFFENSIIKSGLPMVVNYDEISKSDIPSELDMKRAFTLAKNKPGTGHNNFLKGIRVQFDIKYPEYLSPEMQRYHWFDIVSSMSKMHRLIKMRITVDNCNKYVDERIMVIVNEYIDIYNVDPSYYNFMKVVSNCPLGFEKWMTIDTNYLQLKTIYLQRKNHKLKEDWGCICEAIKLLPYANELIIEG